MEAEAPRSAAARSARVPPRWLAPAVDYGPLAIFFLAYLGWDVLVATAAMVAATVAAMLLSLAATRRVPASTLLVAAMVVLFGGLTLVFKDPRYLKLQSTIINGTFAAILLAAYLADKPLLRTMLGAAIALSEAGWRLLTLRFILFFVVMAALNELIARTQSTAVWASYYGVGTTVLTLLFIAAQWPLVTRHLVPAERGPDDPAPR